MITNVDNFIEFLKEIQLSFSKNKFDLDSNLTESSLEITNIYSKNFNLFPINVGSIFDNLLIEHRNNIDTFVHWRLKESYHIYIEFIELDYNYYSNLSTPITDDLKSLFNYSKDLAFRLFAFFSKFYYWHYGKNKNRTTIPINVFFLNEYTLRPDNFDFDSNYKILEKLEKFYLYEYQKIDADLRLKYCDDNIELSIVKDDISCNIELQNAILELNDQYVLKLEDLKKYKKNITTKSPKSFFEFPSHLILEVSNGVTITNSTLVFETLKPFLKQTSFEERFKKLLNGENITEKIDVNCGSHTFVHFIRTLNKDNILTALNLEIINNWIVNNFRFKKGSGYEIFKKETIKTFIKSTAPDPQTIITYSI